MRITPLRQKNEFEHKCKLPMRWKRRKPLKFKITLTRMATRFYRKKYKRQFKKIYCLINKAEY